MKTYTEKEIFNTEIYCSIHNVKADIVQRYSDRGYQFVCSDKDYYCNFAIFLCNENNKYHLSGYDLYFNQHEDYFYLNSFEDEDYIRLQHQYDILLQLPFIDIPLKNFNEEADKLFKRLFKLVIFK